MGIFLGGSADPFLVHPLFRLHRGLEYQVHPLHGAPDSRLLHLWGPVVNGSDPVGQGLFVGPIYETRPLGFGDRAQLFYSLAYMHVYTHPHPWFDASVWISKNVQPGAVIATDTWDDGLPQDLSPQQDSRLDRPVSPGNYNHIDVDVYSSMGNSSSDDNDQKKHYYADTLQRADYLSLATKKLWYTLTDETPEFRPHGYNNYPVTSRYFRALWAGLLGYKMAAEFHNFPSLFGWTHPDDMAEETFSVYDHPRVYLFKKFENVSQARILEILSSDDYVRGINRDIMLAITPDNVDDFISKQKQKLEQEGLLQKLDSLSAPVSGEAPASSKPVTQPAAAPLTPPGEGNPPPNGVVTTPVDNIPPVVAPPGVPGLPDAKTLAALKDLADHPVTVDDVSHLPPANEESASYQFLACVEMGSFPDFPGCAGPALDPAALEPISFRSLRAQ